MDLGAPRLLVHALRGILRGAALAAFCVASGAAADSPLTARCDDGAWKRAPLTSATYGGPTTRYAHGVLGDAIEYGHLTLTYGGTAGARRFELPLARVFEDIAPRIVDIDGDGNAQEVMVVESHQDKGARLALYDGCGLITATPYIGQRNRWLAPVGATDLDGDGRIEVAYVDRPHLAKTLRIWRYADGTLTQVGSYANVSNHKIGWDYIAGGLRQCGTKPEMIVASGDWRSVLAVTFDGKQAAAGVVSAYSSDAMEKALSCSGQ